MHPRHFQRLGWAPYVGLVTGSSGSLRPGSTISVGWCHFRVKKDMEGGRGSPPPGSLDHNHLITFKGGGDGWVLLLSPSRRCQIETEKFRKSVGAIGKETIAAMARAGPEMQARLLKGLGLQVWLRHPDGQNLPYGWGLDSSRANHPCQPFLQRSLQRRMVGGTRASKNESSTIGRIFDSYCLVCIIWIAIVWIVWILDWLKVV